MLDHLIPDTAAMRQDFADFIFDEMLLGKGWTHCRPGRDSGGGGTENIWGVEELTPEMT